MADTKFHSLTSLDPYLRAKVSKIYKKEKQIIRDKKGVGLEQWYKENVSCTSKQTTEVQNLPTNVHIVEQTQSLIKENKSIKRVLQTSETQNENLEIQIKESEHNIETQLNLLDIVTEKYNRVLKTEKENCKLKRECDVWDKKYDSLSQQLETTLEKLDKLQQKANTGSTRNVNKKFKRRLKNRKSGPNN
ncbi:MAG: hypothetical protein ABW185_07195 [Sedimenticola sp.]